MIVDSEDKKTTKKNMKPSAIAKRSRISTIEKIQMRTKASLRDSKRP